MYYSQSSNVIIHRGVGGLMSSSLSQEKGRVQEKKRTYIILNTLQLRTYPYKFAWNIFRSGQIPGVAPWSIRLVNFSCPGNNQE